MLTCLLIRKHLHTVGIYFNHLESACGDLGHVSLPSWQQPLDFFHTLMSIFFVDIELDKVHLLGKGQYSGKFKEAQSMYVVILQSSRKEKHFQHQNRITAYHVLLTYVWSKTLNLASWCVW